MRYQRPGDEARVLDNHELMVDIELLSLVRENSDNILAHAILFGFHDSLARAIASMSPPIREQIRSAISHETERFAQQYQTDGPDPDHRSQVQRIVQEWAEEVNKKVIHHAQKS